MNKQMMIDFKVEQLMNDMTKWIANKTDGITSSVMKIANVFLGYSGTPGTNQNMPGF
jgi:hypothetical protein